MARDNSGKRIKPSRPREVVKKDVLADPNTRRIAAALGMQLDAYVELVLDYAYNPEKEPVLRIADPAQLKELGFEEGISVDAGMKWMFAAIKKLTGKIAAKAVQKTDFQDARKKSVLDVPQKPTSAQIPQGSETLKEDVSKELKRKVGKKG